MLSPGAHANPKGSQEPPRRPGSAWPRLRDVARRFGAHRGGAVAVVWAVVLIPVTLFAGAALDYSRASNVRTALDAAADAAALSATVRNAMSQRPEKAEAAAKRMFETRAAAIRDAADVDLKVKVKDKDGQRTATVTYTAKVPTTLMRLARFDAMPISGEAASSSDRPLYMDFHILLDNSPSMGLAATLDDIRKMEQATKPIEQPDGCAFACHDLSGGRNTYPIARNAGVNLRIDVVRSATQRLMDTAAATAAVPGQFRAALYTFGSSCTHLGLATIRSLTSDLAAVKASASAVDLMTIPYVGPAYVQCTDYEGILSAIRSEIPSPGDGTAASGPQKVLFFVSDGVADANRPQTCTQRVQSDGWQTMPRCQEPMREALCRALKDRGVQIAVLYTTYLPLPKNDHYRAWIAPFRSSIGPNMEACASPGFYFEVSPSQGIVEAMEALFKKVVSQARLTR